MDYKEGYRVVNLNKGLTTKYNMGFLQNMIARFKEKSQREKELDTEIDIQNRVMEKRKSANERELERYGKEAREKMIEGRLRREREKRKRQIWKTTLMRNNTRLYIDNSLNREKKMFLRRSYY